MSKSRKKTKRLAPNAGRAVEILPKPEPAEARLKLHESKVPSARTSKGAGSRAEIRTVSHRVMGSRQSERRIERSHQARQPKRGRGSQRKKSG